MVQRAQGAFLVAMKAALEIIATRPSQSPTDEITCALKKRGKPGVRKTCHGLGGIGSCSGDDGMNGAC